MKDKEDKKTKLCSNKNNAQLFANLILIAILLIGLWNSTSAWEAKLDVGNIILLLVIINTVLLFKNFIFSKHKNNGKEAYQKQKKLKSLKALRILANSTNTNDNQLIQASVEKLKEISGCDYVELTVFENRQSNVIASSGEQPQALLGSKFLLKDNKALSVKYSGQMGTEEISEISEDFKPIKFKSSVARLKFTLVVLNLKNAKIGLCLLVNKEKPYKTNISLSSVAVFFESLIAQVEASQTASGGYKDKETGLILYKNFEDLVDNELERSERYKQEMTLLSIKIKNFDTLEDNEKPIICKNAASAINPSLRRFDLMFYGKDSGTYKALLTECGSAEAKGIAQRLQKEFNKLNKKQEFTKGKKIAMVIGSATYQTDATHSLGLIEKSEDALQLAIEKSIDYKAFSEESGIN